ncbi:type II toxin-antitoxin system VapC family toxin [Asticcacaulis sp. AC460]|uniref:type II toxin-antitoxin system VapC family toxin n=1 Tax=Asticcacaulis sp. AC460 TaxID=1282360 RepID=UPI0004CE9C73|nr:type II toxin-antitoxin system VapC family toxin [Asticcacaulis sp. AC460]
MSDAILLDTCAVIWLANGELSPQTVEVVVHAAGTGGVFVSPISAWEVGLLSRPKPNRTASLTFLPDPKTWFARFMTGPGIKEAPFSHDIAIEASWLPGEIHGDPGDRLIIATARTLQIPVLTRDAKILDYAKGGHVMAIAC